LSCHPTILPRSPPPNLWIFRIVGEAFLFSDINPCPVLPAAVTQLFALRDYVYICGRQDCALTLERQQDVGCEFPHTCIITVKPVPVAVRTKV